MRGRWRPTPGRSRKRSTPAAARGATTRFTPNAQRHESSEVKKPPSTGPSAAPTPMTEPHTANAVARSRPWNEIEIMEIVAGSSSAAPMPSITASPTNRVGTDHDSIASPEPTPNSNAPATKVRRCPNTSPSRPPMTSSDANTSEYPVITHCTLGSVESKSLMMVGIATVNTPLSMVTTSAVMATAASTHQRRGFGRRLGRLGRSVDVDPGVGRAAHPRAVPAIAADATGARPRPSTARARPRDWARAPRPPPATRASRACARGRSSRAPVRRGG